MMQFECGNQNSDLRLWHRLMVNIHSIRQIERLDRLTSGSTTFGIMPTPGLRVFKWLWRKWGWS
jgi:hypothetical protein